MFGVHSLAAAGVCVWGFMGAMGGMRTDRELRRGLRPRFETFQHSQSGEEHEFLKEMEKVYP